MPSSWACGKKHFPQIPSLVNNLSTFNICPVICRWSNRARRSGCSDVAAVASSLLPSGDCVMSRTYRPEVCVLEDRTVPTVLFRQFYALPPTPAPLAANHLIVIVPQNVEAGQNVTVVVKAADATNKVVTSYKGTVNVSLGTSDPSAVIPASFTFSVADQGVHRFTAKLQAVGSQ